MGSCTFRCDILLIWITRQAGPDGVGFHVLCLCHAIPVGQQNGQNSTATSRDCHNMTSDVKATLNPNKQQNNA